MNEFASLVRRARSIRRFDEADRIDEAALRHLVDLARVTPSGANNQPLRYRLVHAPAACATVFAHLAWAGYLRTWDGPAAGERPTGYVVLLSKAASGPPECDLGIAMQTMQLGAHAAGWGCCMFGSIKREALHRALALPEELAIRYVMAFGRPAETVALEDLRAPEDIEYWRDEDGVHHVPKRALEDILV